jgi:hypothetical protein
LNTDIVDAGMTAELLRSDPPPVPDGETPASSTAMLISQLVSDTTAVSPDELTINISNTSTTSTSGLRNTPAHAKFTGQL